MVLWMDGLQKQNNLVELQRIDYGENHSHSTKAPHPNNKTG